VNVPAQDGAPPPGSSQLDGEAVLFGFDPSPVRVTIVARSRAWRVGGAARTMALFVAIAPFVAIFPPHAVWPIGALLAGAFLARRRYVERFTLWGLDGTCPKCGTTFRVKPGRLRAPHSVPCEGCHHEPAIRISAEQLEAIALS
jgi:hypothetical protein